MKKSNRSERIRTAALACSLIAALSVGSAAAYFTDTKETTNTFSVGKVSIELTEPNWNEEEAQDIIPDQEIPKDPVITNDGINDAFIFAKVRVPIAEIVTAEEDGSKNEAAVTQLFRYETDPNWTLVTENVDGGTNLTIQNRTGEYGILDNEHVEYIYAYTGPDSSTMQAVSAQGKTENLFPAVKFVNAVENQGLEEQTAHIVVTGYAIQADFIQNGDGSVNGTNEEGQTAPGAVWKVFQTQNAS